MVTDSTLAPSAHIPTRRSFLAAAPVAAVALAVPAATLCATSGDAHIIAAWDRRVAAYRSYNSPPVPDVDDDGADANFWPVIDQCDTVIHAATAATPLGVEIQIWVGLHNSAAWRSAEENAFLARDLAYMEQNETSFDWDVLPVIAAIRSLRAMGSR
jgi:hypothetical protein